MSMRWSATGGLLALAIVGLATAVELALLDRRRRDAAPVRPPSPPVAEEIIRQELERSRRQQRPCAVVRMPAAAGTTLRSQLRRDDSVLPGGDHVLVLLPQTDRDGALTAIERVAPGSVTEALPELPSTVACYPEDALTVQELLLTLTARPRRRRAAARPRSDEPHSHLSQHGGGLGAVTSIRRMAPPATVRATRPATRRWVP